MVVRRQTINIELGQSHGMVHIRKITQVIQEYSINTSKDMENVKVCW